MDAWWHHITLIRLGAEATKAYGQEVPQGCLYPKVGSTHVMTDFEVKCKIDILMDLNVADSFLMAAVAFAWGHYPCVRGILRNADGVS